MRIFLLVVLCGCSTSHDVHTTTIVPMASDASTVSDASAGLDASLPPPPPPPLGPEDAGLDAPPERADCVPPFVASGNACVRWRTAAKPCDEEGYLYVDELARSPADGRLVVRCDDHWLAFDPDTDSFISYVSHASWSELEPVTMLETDPPAPYWDPLLAVQLADGSRIATHGDVYAIPFAWRADSGGDWVETLAPPSAFLQFAALISDHEALFVGGAAYVFEVDP